MGKEILLSPINHKYWMVMQEIEINGFIVPKGFITDFASVPKVFWMFLPPWNDYGRASILHDYQYCSGCLPKKESDKMMLDTMKKDGVRAFRRVMIFISVSLFGAPAYRKAAKMRKKQGVCKDIYLEVSGDFFEK